MAKSCRYIVCQTRFIRHLIVTIELHHFCAENDPGEPAGKLPFAGIWPGNANFFQEPFILDRCAFGPFPSVFFGKLRASQI
jgi:hypothetical protein